MQPQRRPKSQTSSSTTTFRRWTFPAELCDCIVSCFIDLIHLRQQVPTLSCDSFGSSWIWWNRHSSQQTAHGVKPQSTTEVNETHTLTACYINIYIQQNIVHVIYTVKFMLFFFRSENNFFSTCEGNLLFDLRHQSSLVKKTKERHIDICVFVTQQKKYCNKDYTKLLNKNISFLWISVELPHQPFS